ncbi:MAG: UvrD-helicase domain-containing protein [Caldilineaceae bacterium]
MPSIIADLHLHSHFSRATSADLTLEQLWRWAQLKGVGLLITGDIAHPGWLKEIKEKLEPVEGELFKLKDELARSLQATVPPACRSEVRFLLGGEVSNIYKKHEATRKIHHMLYLPDLTSVEIFQARLERMGFNIRADGRPILGLDSHDLFETLLDVNPRNQLIPAHIWTPWFATLGSKSGFDSIDECFEDLTPQIFAAETGLSSDPPMNWRVSSLDRYTLVSNSDAHSPQKLAREATLFDIELSYSALFDALKSGDPQQCLGTLEFFPEEGKYHVDGHRACGIRWEPEETIAHNGLCSVCGKPVTVGVLHRVNELADRPIGGKPEQTHPYYNLISLTEILGEVYGTGSSSKRVQQSYEELLNKLGAEVSILRTIPLEAIRQAGGELLAEGIRRMRAGEVHIKGGYDGEYGTIKLFEAQERTVAKSQIGLFEAEVKEPQHPQKATTAPNEHAKTVSATAAEQTKQRKTASRESKKTEVSLAPMLREALQAPSLSGLNEPQRAAVETIARPLLIVAGPGTGKTRTLTVRIAHLVQARGVDPSSILAITFTNKAATEMRERLHNLLGELSTQVTVKTFHAFATTLLRQYATDAWVPPDFAICSEDDQLTLLRPLLPEGNEHDLKETLNRISLAKNQLQPPQVSEDDSFQALYHKYQQALRQSALLDFDDLLFVTVQMLEAEPEMLRQIQQRYQWLSVDEYQDINLTQYRLLRLLTAAGANLCAIGDPDQAIYGFRGADRRYFMHFQNDFPNALTLHLDQNYRSTQMIVNASSQVISKSDDRLPLTLRSDLIDPTRLEIHHAPTDKAEAEFVVHSIEQLLGGTTLFSVDSKRATGHEEGIRSFRDFAVLYRLSAQSHALIEAFARSGIPYQVVGATPLVEYKEIREILAYLWLAHNPAAVHYRTLLLEASAKKYHGEIQQLLVRIHTAQATESVATLIATVHDFMITTLHRTFTLQQHERIEKLRLNAIDYGSALINFLEATVLQKETDTYDRRVDQVTLMTLHASKGLEFPQVFIVGCEEEILPYQRPGEECNVEEERRLFYVGMTRAQRKLVLSHARTRFLFGQRVNHQPSRFLNDIEQALLEVKRMAERRFKPEKPEQLALF